MSSDMFTVEHAVTTFWMGVIGWTILRTLLMLLDRRKPPPEPKTATERYIERDLGKHGVYNPIPRTDWDELERDLERTLRSREK